MFGRFSKATSRFYFLKKKNEADLKITHIKFIIQEYNRHLDHDRIRFNH